MAAEEPKKTITLKVRLDPEQRRQLEWAAKHEKLDVSTWVRQVCLRESMALARRARAQARTAAQPRPSR